MLERDLRQLVDFAQRRMLPHRRVELLLAQIAMLIATSMGGAKDVTLRDFLFEPEEEMEEEDADPLESAKQFFGFRPRNSP